MSDDFAIRRQAARGRLDAIDPHKTKGGVETDPYRRTWFNKVYDLAGEDAANVPWADLAPHPLLSEWLAHNTIAGLRALDVGCGLGDNAQALAQAGAKTTAFDLAPRAIEWAQARFPRSGVTWRAADLFAAPPEWRGAFDFVHECYTLQALPHALLGPAFAALADFLAPGARQGCSVLNSILAWR